MLFVFLLNLLSVDIVLKYITKPDNDLVTIVFLICYCILSLVSYRYNKRLKLIFKSFFNNRYINQLTREGLVTNEFLNLFLTFLYFFTISLMLFIINKNWGINIFPKANDFIIFFLILFIVVSFYLLTILFVNTSAVIFKTKNVSYNYLLLIFIHNNILGVILFPFLILTVYLNANLFIYFSIIILVIVNVYRVIKIIVYKIYPRNYSLFHLFIYFCTLEILPLFLIYKLIDRHLI